MNDKKDKEKILVIDFGSQVTKLIARRIRDLGFFSEVITVNNFNNTKDFKLIKGIILSGGPETVKQKGSPKVPNGIFDLDIPILGICYGMQTITKQLGGKVELANKREFGHADLKISNQGGGLFKNIKDKTTSVWMSHGDHVTKLPKGFKVIAKSVNSPIAAFLNRRRKFSDCNFILKSLTHRKAKNYSKISCEIYVIAKDFGIQKIL